MAVVFYNQFPNPNSRNTLPISDDLLTVHLPGPGAALAAVLVAGAPGALDPLRGAGVGVAGLVVVWLERRVAETLVYHFELFARSARYVSCLDTYKISCKVDY